MTKNKKYGEPNVKTEFDIKLTEKDLYSFNIYQTYHGIHGIFSILIVALVFVMAGVSGKNGEIGYTTYNNRYDIQTIPRMSVFTEYYNSTSDTAVYHPYIDANNDKVINAKDFAYIYNAGKGM